LFAVFDHLYTLLNSPYMLWPY